MIFCTILFWKSVQIPPMMPFVFYFYTHWIYTFVPCKQSTTLSFSKIFCLFSYFHCGAIVYNSIFDRYYAFFTFTFYSIEYNGEILRWPVWLNLHLLLGTIISSICFYSSFKPCILYKFNLIQWYFIRLFCLIFEKWDSPNWMK